MPPILARRRTVAANLSPREGTSLLLPRTVRSLVAVLTTAAVVAGLALVASIAAGSSPASPQHPKHPKHKPARRAAASSTADGSPAALGAPYREADGAQGVGRDVRLDIDDTSRTAFAVISNGDPTDEVWLDRSWDGGRTWDSRIGHTRVPRGARSAVTTQWRLDRGAARSLVRGCGKPGNRRQVTCTGWQRALSLPRPGTAWDRGAADALMTLYDRRTGLWRSTGWWNSANALTALVDYMSATHDLRYRWVIANTYDRNRAAKGGQFTNGYLDDTGWWALAWIRAYDLTHRQRYLRTARTDVDHMGSYQDGTCGGGVWWSTAKRYKNAITNELYIKAAAELHTRVPGDRTYLRGARRTWQWFRSSGMINVRTLVNDGLDGRCRNNHGTTWSYNQGVLLGGLVDLAGATGNRGYLRQATRLADASTRSRTLHDASGSLTEPCEADGCGADGPSFKGIYVRNLGELARATSSSDYRTYLRRHARTAHDHGRTPYDQYGVRWTGPAGPITGATQQSALDLMVAALR